LAVVRRALVFLAAVLRAAPFLGAAAVFFFGAAGFFVVFAVFAVFAVFFLAAMQNPPLS
jgi:hypothetical protein